LVGVDVRINTGVFKNPKVFRLKMELGADGVLALLQLWCFTRENYPDGNLSGMRPEEVETLAAGWAGEAGRFVRAMVRLELLDQDDAGLLHVHDWDRYQMHAVKSARRTSQAKRAGRARWEKTKTQGTDAVSMERVHAHDDLSMETEATPPQGTDAVSMERVHAQHAEPSPPALPLFLSPHTPLSNSPSLPPSPTEQTPPPPVPGGDTKSESAPPLGEPGEREPKTGEVLAENREAHPGREGGTAAPAATEPLEGGKPPRDRRLDAMAEELVGLFMRNIATAHRCSRKQAERNARSTIVGMRTERAHAGLTSDEQRVDLLKGCLERYAKATAATDPAFRTHAANFFGRAATWTAYLTDESAAPATTAPRPATRSPERIEADRCFGKTPGCPGKPGGGPCAVCKAHEVQAEIARRARERYEAQRAKMNQGREDDE
jgi:hypothetical protein